MIGCGTGLYDLFYLTDTLIRDNRAFRDHLPAAPAVPGPAAGSRTRASAKALVDQLYEMAGRGQLSNEAFEALRSLADRGQLRPADLAVHRARAGRQAPRGSRGDALEAAALRQVQARLAQLDEARESSAAVLADLESRLDRLAAQIESKEQDARDRVATEEAAARRALTEKAALADSYRRLNEQAQALRNDLARLDEMRLQLEDRAAELEAVLARSELTALGAAAPD
jgi:prefoldin subunit 5